MATFSLTEEQQKAIDPHASIWVTANAGTGKTKVLIDRFINLLFQDTPPENIVCLTFTNAAANEMKERIIHTLGEWVALDETSLRDILSQYLQDGVDAEQLQHARTLFFDIVDQSDQLRIQTIHSFCQSLLRSFPFEAGISSQFELAEESLCRFLFQEAYNRFIANSASEENAYAIATHTLLSEFSEKALYDAVEKIWLNRSEQAALFDIPIDIQSISNKLDAALELDGLRSKDTLDDRFIADNAPLFLQCKAFMQECLQYDIITHEKLQPIADWLSLSANNERNSKFDLISRFFLTLKGTKNSRIIVKAKQLAHPSTYELLNIIQDMVIDYCDKRNALTTFINTQFLYIFTSGVLHIYEELKQERSLLDNEDLLIYTERLLNQSHMRDWIRYKMDHRIDHLLVDEAQDTNLLQWSIINALADEFFEPEKMDHPQHTLFVVGDEKQSIYQFRGASPKSFSQLESHYGKTIKRPFVFHNISMQLSFRSSPPILQLVDSIFSDETFRAFVSYSSADICHTSFRAHAPGKIVCSPLYIPEKTPFNKDISWPTLHKRLETSNEIDFQANEMAQTIRNWLDEQRVLASKNRPIQPKDILILLKKRSPYMPAILKALQAHNIPNAGSDRLAIHSHILIDDMIALAQSLSHTRDDLALAAVLKSPLFGLDEEALYTLSTNREEYSLWDHLMKEECSGVYKTTQNKLVLWKNNANQMTPFDFYYSLFYNHGYYDIYASVYGDEIEDVIHAFLLLLEQYESEHNTHSLSLFIHWFKQQQADVVRQIDASSNLVRIMTVHGAKGLQSSIVFLPDTTSKPSKPSSTTIKSSEHQLFIWPGRAKDRPLILEALLERNLQEEYAEYLRQLYVAITRAEDELYIFGSGSSYESIDGSWYDIMRSHLQKLPDHTLDSEEISNATISISYTPVAEPPANTNPTSPSKEAQNRPNFLDNRISVNHTTAAVSARTSRTKAAHYSHTPADTHAREKGVLIHKWLELLPQLSSDEQIAALKNLLSSQSVLDDKQIETCLNEARALLDHSTLFDVFTNNIFWKSEVAISGALIHGDGAKVMVNGRIDCLIEKDHEILIIDYKTGTYQENTPTAYVDQMSRYHAIISNIYPDKKVVSYLLWTQQLKLIEVTGEECVRYGLTYEVADTISNI